MKFPYARFTMQRIMVAVAVVALGLGVSIQIARWRELARLYEIRAGRLDRTVEVWRTQGNLSHEQWLEQRRAIDEANRKGPPSWGWAQPYLQEPALARRCADRFALLAKKYRRVATQPWWPVEPDPPLPKP